MMQYERLMTLTLDEGLSLIRYGMLQQARSVEARRFVSDCIFIGDCEVRIFSLRLQTFVATGLQCVHPGCTNRASYFAIERFPSKKTRTHPLSNRYHMNLWGRKEDGTDVLYTHDHIIARAHGGADHLSNVQTMCSPHNAAKGTIEQAAWEAAHPEIVEEYKRRNRQGQLNNAMQLLPKALRRSLSSLSTMPPELEKSLRQFATITQQAAGKKKRNAAEKISTVETC